jgi:hypothetical protein
MAAPLLPRDVTEHLAAAIQLSNRHIHLRFLEEAETLLSLQLPSAAVAVAGVVLEFLIAGQRVKPGDLQQVDQWARLRNNSIHGSATPATLDEAKEMVAGVRQLLAQATSSEPPAFPSSSETAPGQIRGKYKFVPTSSEAFIARKADELRLEHQ